MAPLSRWLGPGPDVRERGAVQRGLEKDAGSWLAKERRNRVTTASLLRMSAVVRFLTARDPSPSARWQAGTCGETAATGVGLLSRLAQRDEIALRQPELCPNTAE